MTIEHQQLFILAPGMIISLMQCHSGICIICAYAKYFCKYQKGAYYKVTHGFVLSGSFCWGYFAKIERKCSRNRPNSFPEMFANYFSSGLPDFMRKNYCWNLVLLLKIGKTQLHEEMLYHPGDFQEDLWNSFENS